MSDKEFIGRFPCSTILTKIPTITRNKTYVHACQRAPYFKGAWVCRNQQQIMFTCAYSEHFLEHFTVLPTFEFARICNTIVDWRTIRKTHSRNYEQLIPLDKQNATVKRKWKEFETFGIEATRETKE